MKCKHSPSVEKVGERSISLLASFGVLPIWHVKHICNIEAEIQTVKDVSYFEVKVTSSVSATFEVRRDAESIENL